MIIPLLLVFPVLTTCKLRPGLIRLGGILFSVAMLALLVYGTLQGGQGVVVYVWGCVLSTWAANFLPRDNRLE